MEAFAKKLAHRLLEQDVIRREDFDVYAYGLQLALELSVHILCSLIIALLLHMEIECLLFFLFFIPIRSYGGGLHMKHYLSCLLLSCITLAGILCLVKFCPIPAPFSLYIYLISLTLLLFLGSVNHPNREVDADEHQRFNRKKAAWLCASIPAALTFALMKVPRYLYLEALVFALLAITQLIGRFRGEK